MDLSFTMQERNRVLCYFVGGSWEVPDCDALVAHMNWRFPSWGTSRGVVRLLGAGDVCYGMVDTRSEHREGQYKAAQKALFQHHTQGVVPSTLFVSPTLSVPTASISNADEELRRQPAPAGRQRVVPVGRDADAQVEAANAFRVLVARQEQLDRDREQQRRESEAAALEARREREAREREAFQRARQMQREREMEDDLAAQREAGSARAERRVRRDPEPEKRPLDAPRKIQL